MDDMEEIGKKDFKSDGFGEKIVWHVSRDFTQEGKDADAKALIQVPYPADGDCMFRFHVVGNGVYTRMFSNNDKILCDITENELNTFFDLANVKAVVSGAGIYISDDKGTMIIDKAMPMPFNALAYNDDSQKYTVIPRGSWCKDDSKAMPFNALLTYKNSIQKYTVIPRGSWCKDGSVIDAESFKSGKFYLSVPGETISSAQFGSCTDSILQAVGMLSEITEHDIQKGICEQLGWLGVPILDDAADNNGAAVIEYAQDIKTRRFTSALLDIPSNARCAQIQLLSFPDKNESGVFNLYKNMVGSRREYQIPVTCNGDLLFRI